MKKIIVIYSFGFLAMFLLVIILVVTKLLPGEIGDYIVMIGGIIFAILSFFVSKKSIKSKLDKKDSL